MIRKYYSVLLCSLAGMAALSGSIVQAGPIDNQETCNFNDVTVTSYTQIVGGSNSASGLSTSASACLGLYQGLSNGGNFAPLPDFNLGLAGDGLMNGQNDPTADEDFTPGAFVGNEDLYSIGFFNEEDEFVLGGDPNDPGWIYLGKVNTPGNFLPLEGVGNIGPVEYDDELGDDNPLGFLDEIFSLTCTSTDDDGDCSSGTWALTPPTDIIEQVNQILPGVGYFQAFALVFKGSKSASVYEFLATDILGDGVDLASEVYEFGGAFTDITMYNQQGKPTGGGVSNVQLYVLDPPLGETPEPRVLSLLAAGLLAFGWTLRAKRRQGSRNAA